MKIENKYWRNADFYVMLVMFLICGILGWQICGVSVSESRILPFVAFAIIFLSALYMLINFLRRQAEFRNISGILVKSRELCIIVLLLISYFLYELLGFYTTVAIFVFGVSLVLEHPLTPKKVLSSIIYCGGLMALLYFCFAVCLGMVTPAGLFI